MSTVTHDSGFVYTDADGLEVVHRLAVPLLFRAGSYGDVKSTRRAVAIDQRTIQVEEFSAGAEEVEAVIRLDGDARGLRSLLREGAGGRTLTYRPNLAIADEYDLALMDYGDVTRVPMDADRYGFNEWQATVRLRRLDGGELDSLVSDRLAFVRGAGPMAGVTFTRGTVGTRIDRNRVIESIAAGDRRVTWMERDGVLRPFGLYESARTQQAADPDDPNSWTDLGTPVITTGQADPFGTSTAILVEDDDAAALEGKQTACTFSGNATKAVTIMLAEGTAGVLLVRIVDGTASAVRHDVSVTWNASDTPPTVATASGAGTIYDSVQLVSSDGRRWWMVRFSADGVIAANTNLLEARVGPANTDTGTFYLAGGNAFDATYPSSWQATAATRNADQHVQTYPFAPQAASGYWRFRELAEPNWIAAPSAHPRIFQVATSSDRRFNMTKLAAASTYRVQHFAEGSSVSSTVELTPGVDDDIELFPQLYDNGSVQLHGRVNGGSITSGIQSGALALPDSWAEQLLHVGSVAGDGHADIALDVGALWRGELTTAQILDRAHAYAG